MRAAIATGLAVLVTLAGCGSAERQTVPPAKLVAAAERTRLGPPQRLHVDVVVNAFATELHVPGDGLWDPRTDSARLTLDMSDVAGLAGASRDPASRTAEVKVENGAVSVRWPPLAQRLGSGEPSLRFSGDPVEQAVSALRALKGDPEVTGQARVRGVPTTRYRATLDPKRLRGVPVSGDELPVEVWIGNETDRIHKVRARAPVALPNGPGFDLDATLELSGVRR